MGREEAEEKGSPGVKFYLSVAQSTQVPVGRFGSHVEAFEGSLESPSRGSGSWKHTEIGECTKSGKPEGSWSGSSLGTKLTSLGMGASSQT
jgi:hypothetical protein